jgi:uncharacterized protein YndB with AHSA1/START domain
MFDSSPITVQVDIPLPITEVWLYFTSSEHIVEWNFASSDWWCPFADCYLKVGKSFKYRMEAKDGSFGFDFSGVFTHIEPEKQIDYVLDDGRKVTVVFAKGTNSVSVVESFEPETQNSRELQQQGWQAILNNFASYALLTYATKND